MYNKYDWQEAENKLGRTLEDVYTDTRSLRLTGIVFGKPFGVYAVTQNTISAELKRRGVKINSVGGSHKRPWVKAYQYRIRITAVKDYQKKTRAQILYETGLKYWQFYHAYCWKPFDYVKIHPWKKKNKLKS